MILWCMNGVYIQVYDGQWCTDAASGMGKMVYADQGIYEGEWRSNKKHGKGTMTYAGSI